jgi:hypothetical protein
VSQIRVAVKAYKTASTLGGCDIPRIALATAHAVELAEEVIKEGAELRHTQTVKAAIGVYATLRDNPAAHGSEAEILRGSLLAKAADEFWSAFEGEPIDGVEILRKRA